MSCHDHSHNYNNIKIAFWLNFGFAIIEIIGGVLTNSVAILSDALHDFGDSISIGLSWWLEKYSTKGPSERFTYGYRRFSLLGGLINAVVLLCGSVFVLYATIPRLFSPEQTHPSGMIFLAILGLAVNAIAVIKVSSGKSENMKVITWHLLEDVLGWAAVLIGSIIMYFTDFFIIDPIMSLGITGYILFNVYKRLNSTISLFLQATPTEIKVDNLIAGITKINGVNGEHHTHAWSLDGEHHVLSTHISVDPTISPSETTSIKQSIRALAKEFGFIHVTVEIESQSGDCSTP